MATIVLQTAGAFIGGLFGPVGAILGRAVGGLAGYSIDRSLIASTQRFEGPRMTAQRPFSAEEGAPVPRVFGTVRVGGSLIWATRFEEQTRTERQGGKGGGPKVTSYTYFANAAFALCEGEIAGVRRIWADGREIERDKVTIRIHRGTQDQAPDPLIAARQGGGNAPAYRGLAYVVIDRLPIAEYGNRLPQFQFEVLRPVGSLHQDVRAVTLIPGSTEYGLSTEPVRWQVKPGETRHINRNVLHGPTDIVASLDELQALCPNLEHVSLVVSWFGDDLRAGSCRIRPMVTTNDATPGAPAWSVNGMSRAAAATVSQVEGRAAYGGTPSDRSVIQAIRELKARGLKVTLHPFIMMDVPAGNDLPDPYGGDGQAAYPWRGRITCHPTAGVDGSVDRTAAAGTQVAAFVGSVVASQIGTGAAGTTYSGPAGDWGFRRFILHHARLAQAAGGVEAFFLGSEMRGVTTIRDAAGGYPFVDALVALAADVKAMLGETKITYAADWSEYFGHQPTDDSDDVAFHLDPLWASAAIGAVGIDNYMPLSDWRDGDYAGGNPDGAQGPYDGEALGRAVAGGEGFDWYYVDAAARQARERLAITDAHYGKPWLFRPKDLVGWWSNQHYNRVGGVEAGTPTAWVPRSKPIWFTELGCPAVDKGPNQPNVFPDPKSSEDATPTASDGGRSEAAQRAFLEAHFSHWQQADANPVSDLYGAPMVDLDRLYLWCWDARPYPAFPQNSDLWADGAAWQTGHWLNGRLSGLAIEDVIGAVLSEAGLPPARFKVVTGTVQGFIIEEPSSARAVLEPLCDLFGIAALEDEGALTFIGQSVGLSDAIEIDDMVVPDDDAPTIERQQQPGDVVPGEVELGFRDPMQDHQAAVARIVRGTGRRVSIGFAGTIEAGQAEALATDWLVRQVANRETLRFAVPPNHTAAALGRVIEVADARWRVTGLEDGLTRQVEAVRLMPAMPTPWRPIGRASVGSPPLAGPPHVLFLELPMVSGAVAPEARFMIAARARPWRSQVALVSPATDGFAVRATIVRPATIGRLASALPPGASGRVSIGVEIEVELYDGELSSTTRLQMLNGANAAAVRSATGDWEVLQFESAEEIAPSLWKITGLLRGQVGTEDASLAGAPAGADFVILDDALVPAGLLASEAGLSLNWKVGPVGDDLASGNFVDAAVAGGLRARQPLSPVHLTARRAGDGSVSVSWVRRGRIDADGWDGSEIPLGEEREAYLVELMSGEEIMRSVEVVSPAWTYPAAAIASDFETMPAMLDLRVRQIGALMGLPTRRTISIN